MTAEPEDPEGADVVDVAAHIQRADLLDDLGRYAEAAEELWQALALEPENPEALATLALIELRAGRARQALPPAEAALAIRPDHLLGQVVRGHVLAALGRTDDAVDAAEALLRADEESWLRQLHFAAIVRRVRNGQATLDAAWRAVQLAPEEPETHLVLAAVAAGLGLADVAEHATAEATRLDPTADRADTDVLRLRQADGTAAAPRRPAPPPAGTGRRALARLLSVGALYAWGSPLLVVLMLVTGPSSARMVSALAGLCGLAAIGVAATRTGPEERARLRSALRGADRFMATAAVAVLLAPLTLLWYAATGSPWPLGVVVLLGALAFTALVVRVDGDEGTGLFRR